MPVYIVTLASTVPVVKGRPPLHEEVEHEGHLTVEAGALVFREEMFGLPFTGYAPGQWLRFDRKED